MHAGFTRDKIRKELFLFLDSPNGCVCCVCLFDSFYCYSKAFYSKSYDHKSFHIARKIPHICLVAKFAADLCIRRHTQPMKLDN